MFGIGYGGFALIILFAIIALFIVSAIFQWLWNITMPEAFDLKRIRYWVAFRLLLMAGILSSAGFSISHGA